MKQVPNCFDCGDDWDDDDLRQTTEGLICPSCMGHHSFFECERCGMLAAEEVARGCSECPRVFCHEYCLRQHESSEHGAVIEGPSPPRNRGSSNRRGPNLTPQIGETLGTFDRALLSGVEIEADGTADRDFSVLEELPDTFGITTDASIPDGRELQLPPSTGDRLEEHIRQACDTLERAGLQTEGTRAGVHIHVNFPFSGRGLTAGAIKSPLQDEHVYRLIRTAYAVEDILAWLTTPSRALSPYFSFPLRRWYPFGLDYENAQEAIQFSPNGGGRSAIGEGRGRYGSLNLRSILDRGTVEFRYFDGSLDPDEIIGWTKVCHEVVNYAVNDYDLDGVLRMLSVPGPDTSDSPYDKIDVVATTMGWSDELWGWVEERALQDWEDTDPLAMTLLLHEQDEKPVRTRVLCNRLMSEWTDMFRSEITRIDELLSYGEHKRAADLLNELVDGMEEEALFRRLFDENEHLESYRLRRRVMGTLRQRVMNNIDSALNDLESSGAFLGEQHEEIQRLAQVVDSAIREEAEQRLREHLEVEGRPPLFGVNVDTSNTWNELATAASVDASGEVRRAADVWYEPTIESESG